MHPRASRDGGSTVRLRAAGEAGDTPGFTGLKHLRLAVNCFLMILTFLDLDIWLKAENQSISTYKGF